MNHRYVRWVQGVMRVSLTLGMLSLVFGCSHAGRVEVSGAELILVRSIENGSVLGAREQNGSLAWRGIRYAKAPSGEYRWRAPRPPKEMESTFDAREFGDRCPQIASRLDQLLEGLPAGKLIGSEDCLSVNIYAPSWARRGSNLPVMYWVHGGSNIRGRASVYNGADLAEDHGVVVVTVQYRLGPLGFFAHPDLRSDAKHPLDGAANFALLDLIAGLQWVDRNIEAFGGAQNNITVFGESAGALNTVALLASPAAKGLFHRAIVQSGGTTSVGLSEAESTHPYSAIRIAAKLGGIESARNSNLEALFAAYDYDLNGDYKLPIVIEDGITLPRISILDALADSQYLNNVPVIIGANKDEVKIWQFVDDSLVTSAFRPFWKPKNPIYYNARAKYLSLTWIARGVDHPLLAMSKAGNKSLYAYAFEWDGNHKSIFFDFQSLLGATHGAEIAFVFGDKTIYGSLKHVLYPWRTRTEQHELEDTIQRLWTSFARDGVPSLGGGELFSWTPWNAAKPKKLVLDAKHPYPNVRLGELTTVENVIETLRNDVSLSDEMRCRLVIDLDEWQLDGIRTPELPLQRVSQCKRW